MAFHFIAVTSHYTTGKRIGWIYSNEDKLEKEVIQEFLKRFKRKCGDLQLGVHKLSTDSTEIESVIRKDSFFEDVIFTRDMNKFIDLSAEDKELSAYDVAKFILSVLPSTHLKLQKLLYLCYAEFLQGAGAQLFKDPIVAYKYGPVVEDVYHRFKAYKASKIEVKEDNSFIIGARKTAVTPSFMRIALSLHGLSALQKILDVVVKYKDVSAEELVALTHRAGGPWDKLYKPGENVEMTPDMISVYHPALETK